LQVAQSEKQRDEALGTIKALTDKIEKLKISSFKPDDLRGMPIQKLKTLQVRTENAIKCDNLFLQFRVLLCFSQNCVATWKKLKILCIH
jgi:hypothetical protein